MRASRFGFPVAVVVLAFLYLTRLIPGLYRTRIWEDEAFNMSVPVNLVHGLGYASSGLLTTGFLEPFDVRISTGPAVLFPIAAVLGTGIDPALGGRAVMGAFAILLAVALYLVGARLSGRWGGLLAAATPLAFNAATPPSPIQGPTDILGEYPAAAFLVLSLLTISRRPFLSGVFVGLAIQSKTLAVLSLPVLVLAAAFSPSALSPLKRLLRAVRLGLGAAVPVLLFELGKLLALGWTRYWESTTDLFDFLSSGGQTGYLVSIGDKLKVLLADWSLPPWLAVAATLVVAATAIGYFALWVRRGRPPLDRQATVLALTLLGLLAVWVGWWVLTRHDPAWIRHPTPGLLAAVPLLLAVWWRAIRSLSLGKERARSLIRAVAAVAVVGVFAVQMVSQYRVLSEPPYYGTLSEQRAAAEALNRFPTTEVRGDWGMIVSVSFLAGRRPVMGGGSPEDPEAPWLIEAVDRSPAGVTRTRDLIEERCGRTVDRVGIYVFCEPRS